MENAKKNLVSQITDLIQKYTDEYLKINENEKDTGLTINPISNSSISMNFNIPDSNEYQESSSFDEINNFFKERKDYNDRVINLLKELRNGKYDDVFSYYNFKRDSTSNQNNNRTTTSNLASFISEDYPLVKKREQRKDIEMISDPQMVLNFPAVSNLSKNLYSTFNNIESNSSPQQEHSIEMPIRKSSAQKKRNAPSIKNLLFSNNQTSDNEETTNSNIDTQSSSNISKSKPITPPTNKIINLTQSPSLPIKTPQDKPMDSHQLSQPNVPLKFLDLYPPDPPLVLPPVFSQQKKAQKDDFNDISQKSFSPLIPLSKHQEDENNSPSKAGKTINQKSELHFLSSNSSSNSSLPVDNFEAEPITTQTKSPNPFTSPKLNGSRSPFRTTSFKPIISSPISSNINFLASTSASASDKNSRENSSVHSSFRLSASSSQNQSTQQSSSTKNSNSEEESDGPDSIVEFSSPIQRQNEDDENKLNQIKPIITGEDVINKEKMKFLSEDDTEINRTKKNKIQSDDANKNEQINQNKNSHISSSPSKKDQSDSSSEFDESNLSQTLQQSGFIFQNNNVHSQRNMVRSSENPYTRLDAITRLPIRK